MIKFLSVATYTIVLFWLITISVYLFYGIPLNFLLSKATTSKTLNYSIYHWKQKGLEVDTVIIGSSMALNNFHRPSGSKLSATVFGSWGLNPSQGLHIFSRMFFPPKLSLIPLSLPEATMDPTLTDDVRILYGCHMNTIAEWRELKSRESDTLAFTNLNFHDLGNVPLATIKDGFHLVDRRTDFRYEADSSALEHLINNPLNRSLNIRYILLPWRDKHHYSSISVWMDRKRNDPSFIDLRDCPIESDSWLDGTHLDSIGAMEIYTCLERKLITD